jgi:hypothetical protein
MSDIELLQAEDTIRELRAEIERLRAAIKSVSSKECPCTTCQILWRALGAKSVRNDGEGEYVKLKIDDA